MSEQVWDFAGIHAAIATCRMHAGALHGQTEELSGLLGRGQSEWEGQGGEAWAIEQQRLNARKAEFEAAVNDVLNSTEEAVLQMQATEGTNAASFV